MQTGKQADRQTDRQTDGLGKKPVRIPTYEGDEANNNWHYYCSPTQQSHNCSLLLWNCRLV